MRVSYVNYGIFLHGFNIKNSVNSVANTVSKPKREKNQQLVSSVN